MSETNYSQNTSNHSLSTQQTPTAGASHKPPETYGDFVGISIILLIVSILWLRKHK